jgi:2-polyprenyl-6-methoxyphenol hydroxylase-like FAD-dependent oxidoreductase
MERTGRDTVVIGAGVGGLTAAGALSESFDRVVVVERDHLPDGPTHRKGVPQAHQTHVLMPLGRQCVEDVFPGFTEDMNRAGVPVTDVVREMVYWGPWGWRARTSSAIRTINATRPLIDHVLRERVRALPNVEFVQGSVMGFLSSEDHRRICGVWMDSARGRQVCAADLVVDATGRGSKSAAWLEEMGYQRPEELTVTTNCGYSARLVRVPEDVLPPETTLAVSLPYPGHHRGAHLFRQENGLWNLTALGMNQDYPPRGEDGFLDFIADSWTPYIAEIGRNCEPVTDVKHYRFKRNRRCRWEKLERRPRGFIPIGDAIACFNPIYGQGMSVAAYEARALRETLRELDGDLDSLPERFLTAAQPAIDWAFTTATTFDAIYPDVEIRGEMDSATQEELLYIMQVDQLASADPAMHELFYRYLGAMEEEVFSEETRKRVAEWVALEREPLHTDPMAPPPISEPAASLAPSA